MPEPVQLTLDLLEPGPLALLTPEEMFNGVNEPLLRKLAEDRRYEVKSNGIHAKELGEYFSMWANTAPAGGLIVVGIRNDTTFEGCSRLDPKRLNEIEASGSDYCPDAIHLSKRVPIRRDQDGAEDFVVVFFVKYHPSKVVRTSSGKVYVRWGDQRKELKRPEEIAQLQEQKGEVRFETEPVTLEYPGAFDTKAIADLAASVRLARGWGDHHTNEGILELLHLGKSKGGRFTPNVACALLFARDPREVVPGCRIRFLRFEGERLEPGADWNATKDEFIDGTIPQQIERTAEILRSQLRTFSRLGPGGLFTTVPEYPEDAWYEAIVNACVHRSYGNGVKNRVTFVKMFDDRLEVESPGPFLPFVTPATIGEYHDARNPFLMEAMYHMKFVKMASEGIRRMKAEMSKVGLPSPEFSQEDVAHTFVRVTLRNNRKQRKEWIDSDVAELLGPEVAASLDRDEKRIINYIGEYDSINVAHAARITQRDWGTADRTLRRLAEIGILRREAKPGVIRDPKARYILDPNLREKKSK